MRMSKQKIDQLRAALAPLDTEERRQAYRLGRFPGSSFVTDLDKRYRWDLFWSLPGRTWHTIATGLNNDHIDTGLRRVVAPL